MTREGERGGASVEHAALALLVAVIAIAAIAALSSGPAEGGREVGSALARKLRCAARGPGPCWRDPLTEAYGRPLAGLVRAWAPAPATVAGLYAVDFRRCRRTSCALPGERSPRLTASNRRTSAFVSVEDRRLTERTLTITYWLYRPTLGWQRIAREATSEDVARHARTPLLDADVPALVALETLPGRNHFRFPATEEPPWRWLIVG